MDLESKLADVFLINTADGHPFAGIKHGCFSSPADHIHAVSLAPCYCNRVEETVTATSLLAANGVAISKGYRCYLSNHNFLTVIFRYSFDE
jgi:hypothetical protein